MREGRVSTDGRLFEDSRRGNKDNAETVCTEERREGSLGRGNGSWLTITPPTPLFFISVDSKGFSFTVSSLFATLTGAIIYLTNQRKSEMIWAVREGYEAQNTPASDSVL